MLLFCSTQLYIAILVSLTSLVCLVRYLLRRKKRLMADIPRKLCGESEMLERNKLSLCHHAQVPISTCLQSKNAKLSSKPNQENSGALKTGHMVEKCLSAKLQPEGKERQQKVLELDMKQLMIEEDTIDRLELNLKHKSIKYFWGITTPFEESIMLMISKSPPDTPASGAQIEHVVREITFIDSKIKQRLEWHIVWKKLQHNWNSPVPIQISQETFIPSAPKLIEFQLKIRLDLAIVHVPAEPVILPDGHPEVQEMHVMKSNKNYKQGLPKSNQLSVCHFIPADPQRTGIIIQPQKQSMSAITVSPKCKNKLKSCSKKHSHDINMLYCLPDIVPKFCVTAFSPITTNTLPKLIKRGKGFTKSRSLYIPFIQQDAVDRLELNLRHKQISQLQGLENLHEESLKLMISQEQCIGPSIKIIITKIAVPRALKSYFVSNPPRFLLEWHIKQKTLEHNWNVPLHILRSQQEFIPCAPKLIVSQLKPQPDFDLYIIPIEPAFLCAESKKKLELNVKKKVINYPSGLPKFVRLSLENFISCAPSVCFVKSQLGTEKNVSQAHSKFKTTCLPSRLLLQPKGGKLTVHHCKQTIKFVQSSDKKILPVFACLKLEYKDKLEMCLTKQHLNIKLNNLPSNVQEFYENVYSPGPKITLSMFLIAGKSRKKVRPRYIPFFEDDAMDRLEKNLMKKLSAHILGFQTMLEESMGIMIPKAPRVLPAIKANPLQIEAVPMETLPLSRDIKGELEWHLIKKNLQNRGLPFYYQNSMETFIPPAPKLAPQLNPQVDFPVLIMPCELISAYVEISKKIEFNIKKKVINRIWGIPNIIQLSLKNFVGSAPSVKIVKSSKSIVSNKNDIIRQTKYLQKMFVLSAQSEREKRESKLKSSSEFIFTYLKEKDKDKLDHCLMKQLLEICMHSLPKMVMKFYKMSYLPKPKKSFPWLIVPRNGVKKTRSLFLSFVEQYVVDQLELNLKHKQISNFWGASTLYDESLGLMICSGPPVPLTVKAIATQIEPVCREIYFTEVQKDFNMHVSLKKLQQNWSMPLHVQKSVNAFILSTPKLVSSDKNLQPDFLIIFSQSELTFLDKENKRRLEFNIRKRIVNRKWGFPKVVVSSLHNFMVGAPSMKDLILQCEITKNKKIMDDTSVKGKSVNDTFPLQVHGNHLLPQNERASNNKKASNKIEAFSGLKVEHQDKLNICVTKQSLEIKMHSLSKLVTVSYQNTYTTPSKTFLPRLIASKEELKKPRLMSILFIEQEVVNHLELNLKHKQLLHLWASETQHEISVGILIPKGPNVYPVVGSEGVQIEPISIETTFIEVGTQNILDWHITQKNLESNWHLPLHVQISIDMHIPSAPKLVPCQLKQHCFYAAGIISAELLFMGFEGRKRLERNIKKKIINQKCGLPSLILLSLKDFLGMTFSKSDVEFNSKIVIRHKEGILLSVTDEDVSKEVDIRKINQFPEFAILEKECKYKLNVCLLKQILNAKMHFLPYFAREWYNKFKPLSKKKLSCMLFVSEGFIKRRPWYLPFVEQDAIGDLELNIKQKQMVHLWKFETLYEKSMEIMIPKGPPVHPAIKASGAKIVHVCMEKAVEYDIRDRLNGHITQKKQQNHDCPLHIQISTEFFIQTAPKLILSQLNPKPCFEVIVVPNELTFLCKEHEKLLELNTKKKIINHKCGLPTLIQSSLKNFMGTNSLSNQVMFMEARNTEVNNNILPNKFGMPLQYRKDNKEIEKVGNDLFYVSENPEWKHILETCVIKMSLEIKIAYCPEIVAKFYPNTYPPQLNKSLPKLIVPGGGFKKRPCYLSFVEQGAIDHLELNLKHKHIIHLWKVKNQYDESKEIMISERPPVMPRAKGSGAPRYPVNLETIFIEDEVKVKLQWHISQKKLQLNFGLSLHIQKSQEEFIQSAPKLIPSWVKEEPAFSLFFHSAELFFLSSKDRRCLEMITRKRIICYKWGLPKAVQHSMNNFMSLFSVQSEITKRNAPSLSSTQAENGIVGVPMSMCLQTKNAKLSSKQNQRCSEVMVEMFVFTKLQLEWKEKLESCLIKHCLDIKTCFLPDMVCKLYDTAVSKKLLPQPMQSGKGARKARSLYIAFIEQNAVDCLELNLKHKTIIYSWGIKTPFEKSVTLMIPKPPADPPAIKISGAQIEHVVREMIFIDSEIKERLEWFIVRMKVQHSWGYPVHIQISQETFMPVMPKLIAFQLKPWFGLAIAQRKTRERLEWKIPQKNLQYIWGLPVHIWTSLDAFCPLAPKLNLSQLYSKPNVAVPSENASFSDESIEILNQNIKKKIINHKWGLPKVVYSSFIQFMGIIPVDILPSNGTNGANIIYNNLGKNHEIATQSTKVEMTMHEVKELFSNLHLSPEGKCNVNICLTKQSLEMKMDCIPKVIKDSFKVTYSLVSKRQLTKVIVPGIRFKRKRRYYIPFVEQDVVDGIGKNLKHRQILYLWGLETLYEKSIEIMIPKGPQLPPLIKTDRAKIKPIEEAAPSFSEKVTKLLEWHILQENLQHVWGSLSYFKRSVKAFIPAAPKLILSQLHPQLNFEIEFTPDELAFINNEDKNALEINTKKRIVNQGLGLPKVIESSFSEFMGPSPTIDEICSSTAINLTSFPLTIQEDLIFYLTQNADYVTLASPSPYTNCDECIRNNEPYLEQLSEESKINIQQDPFVKITTRGFTSQNEKGNNQIKLSEVICDSLGERMGITSQISDDGNYFCVSDEELSGACYESLIHSSRNHIVKKKCRKKHCFSNQTKPKTKFFRQSSERQKMFNYEEKNAELIRQDIVFVGPTEELQITAIDQKLLMHEMSDNPKDNQHSSQVSTLHCTGCQVLPSEDSPFATYKHFEGIERFMDRKA